MFIRIVISNFLSFKEETEFNMLAAPFRQHTHHVYPFKSLKLLKASAVYGANAAGKSNLIKAVSFLKKIVQNGKLPPDVSKWKFRLDAAYRNRPVHMEIEFTRGRNLYLYGLEISDNRIEKEWLYKVNPHGTDRMLFERETTVEGKHIIRTAPAYRKAAKNKLLFQLLSENLLKEKELLLKKLAELNFKEPGEVLEWFRENLIVIYPDSKFLFLIPLISISEEFRDYANHTLSALHTGIDKIEIKQIPLDRFFGEDSEAVKEEIRQKLSEKGEMLFSAGTEHVWITSENGQYTVKRMEFIHKNKEGDEVAFHLTDESDGTKRMLDFIPMFFKILKEKDVTFFIDEIDRSLHPVLLKEWIQSIMDAPDTKGQMVFTTHESHLLDMKIFRPDEIWFAEKNEEGATVLYSLSDFKPRPDLDIRKGYLKGRFGAIPFLADLKKLNWQVYEKKARI